MLQKSVLAVFMLTVAAALGELHESMYLSHLLMLQYWLWDASLILGIEITDY